MMILESPTKLILPEDTEAVRRFLTFIDRSVSFQINKAKRNYRWANSDPEGHAERIAALKEQSHRCLLMHDTDGRPYTYSGLLGDLQQQFKWAVESKISPSEPSRSIPYINMPPTMRKYQEEAFAALIAVTHGAISLPTGSGKSRIVLELCKRFPVKTIVMSPSGAITDQLYKLFVYHFGQKFVGKYGDGKKDFKKLFTVATAQALTRIESGTDAHESLSKAEMFIADESHCVPADTFEAVCMGIAAEAKRRFFVSATQIRTDGSEMLLKGIIGQIVYSKKFKDLVDEGYLAKPIFKIFKVPTHGYTGREDVKAETRAQMYGNPNVNKLAAQIACKAVSSANRQSLIIIEEFKQFAKLLNHLTVPFKFVHGGITEEAKEFIPREYWDCDREEAIAEFNEGKLQLLIGTSAISTGVDLKPVGCLVYLQGGCSEIKVKQSIGRGTRLVPGKKDFWVVDFLVTGSKSMERHTKLRQEFYETMGDVQIYG